MAHKLHNQQANYRAQARARETAFLTAGVLPDQMKDFMSRTLWTAIVWEYLYRCNRDYERAFRCPCCGSLATAPIVLMDGTALASAASLVGEASIARAAHEKIPIRQGAPLKHGLPLSQRCIIENVAAREALLRLRLLYDSQNNDIERVSP